MEDWQEWQVRADQAASDLGGEIDALDGEVAVPESINFRSFWPRFRDLKERIRVAPAIKLDDKFDLERRLRSVGSRAYRAQEQSFARSSERKAELLPRVEVIRDNATGSSDARELRDVRRELDGLRKEFEGDRTLVPVDRQALWDAWRAANQFVWDRLNEIWGNNETVLRDILQAARQESERDNVNGVRQQVRRFFETLRSHEAKQDVVNSLKAEAEQIRRGAEEAEEQRQSARIPSTPTPVTAGDRLDTWRAELARNNAALSRLGQEVDELERQFQDADSVLHQAMVRGNLVEKRRKVTELERLNRALQRQIEQSEESPLIPTA